MPLYRVSSNLQFAHKPHDPVLNKAAVLVMNPAADFTMTDRTVSTQAQPRSGPAIYHQGSVAAVVSNYDEPLGRDTSGPAIYHQASAAAEGSDYDEPLGRDTNTGDPGDGELYYSEPFAEQSTSAEAVYSVVGDDGQVPDGSHAKPPLPDGNYAPPGPVNLNMYHEIGGVNDYLAPMVLAAGAQSDDARYASADGEEEAAAYYSTVGAEDPSQRYLVPFQARDQASVYGGFGAGSADAIYAEAEDASGFC